MFSIFVNHNVITRSHTPPTKSDTRVWETTDRIPRIIGSNKNPRNLRVSLFLICMDYELFLKKCN